MSFLSYLNEPLLITYLLNEYKKWLYKGGDDFKELIYWAEIYGNRSEVHEKILVNYKIGLEEIEAEIRKVNELLKEAKERRKIHA